MVLKMDQASKKKQMSRYILDNGKTAKNMEKENAWFLQLKYMKEITRMVSSMDQAVNLSKMVIHTQEATMKENSMDQVDIVLFRRLYMGKFFKI